jgi:thiol-disulfide isomerase/thioredoxin
MQEPVLDPQVVRMPDLAAGDWLNTTIPLNKAALHGRVVLIDFWDSTCANCLRTIPVLNAWHGRYAGLGLLIIGVHAPEFRFARQTETVATAVRDLNIQYPILLDNDFETWTRFANRAWPTKHLVDHQGYIRLRRQGEGYYHEIELALHALLRRRDPTITLPDSLLPLRPIDAPGAVCYRSTPELHAGYSSSLFGSALGNPEGFVTGSMTHFSLPQETDWEDGQFYLEGNWRVDAEYVAMVGEAAGRVALTYRAAGVNAVLGPIAKTVHLTSPAVIEVRQDGRALTPDTAGADVSFDENGRSLLLVDRPRMVEIVRNPRHGAHSLELLSQANGLTLYTFTFETCLAASHEPPERVVTRR